MEGVGKIKLRRGSGESSGKKKQQASHRRRPRRKEGKYSLRKGGGAYWKRAEVLVSQTTMGLLSDMNQSVDTGSPGVERGPTADDLAIRKEGR